MTQLYKSDMHLVFPSFTESCFDTMYNSVSLIATAVRFKDSLFKKSFNDVYAVVNKKIVKWGNLSFFKVEYCQIFTFYPFYTS